MEESKAPNEFEIALPSLDDLESQEREEEEAKKSSLQQEYDLFKQWRETKNSTIVIEPASLPSVETTPPRPVIAASSSSTSPATTNPRINSTSPKVFASHPMPPERVIYASPRQQKNPILQFVKHVKLEFREDVIPDFIFGKDMCALYISLKYYVLNPNYLPSRMASIKNMFKLRIVLCMVDLDESQNPLLELSILCLQNEFTMILCFSKEEVARYLELYRIYHNKPATIIKTKVEDEYMPRLLDTMTTIKSINKTDVATLLTNFGSLRSIMNASMEELLLCPGFGEKKIKRMHQVFTANFTNSEKTSKKKQTKLEFG